MQKFEMEKQKISYEISGESHVCFSEIGISTENQVSNITEKRENLWENGLLWGGESFPTGGWGEKGENP